MSAELKNDVNPRGVIEAELVEIWKEILNLPTIDTAKNFFNLGGDSVTALSMLLRIQEQFSTEISIESFFNDPTIGGLANLLSDLGRLHIIRILPVF